MKKLEVGDVQKLTEQNRRYKAASAAYRRLLRDVHYSLGNGGYDETEELGKLFARIDRALSKKY